MSVFGNLGNMRNKRGEKLFKIKDGQEANASCLSFCIFKKIEDFLSQEPEILV